MHKKTSLILSGAVLALAGYLAGNRTASVAYAHPSPRNQDQSTQNQIKKEDELDYASRPPLEGSVPKSYGRVAAVIPDQIGTGLIFEAPDGVIRFVSMTGMNEGELARYDGTPTHGGVAKSYGHLVSAVVNPNGTALVFEDQAGVIRFVTLTEKKKAN